MKKLLGLLALTVAVSAVASADQDVLKSINATTEIRQGWTDKSGNGKGKGNELGNEGFKKANKTNTKWRNVVKGELKLVDEWDLDASFKVQHDNDRVNSSKDKSEGWETNFELAKPVKIGPVETTTALGWTHKSSRDKINGTQGSYHTVGQSNEIYFGPTFGINVLGQNISTTLQAVYFNTNGDKKADYVYKGSAFERRKTEGYGFNADFSTDGKIFEGSAGKLGYYVNLNHHLRDGGGKLVATGKEAKSSVYLDYVVGATYTTPSFAGFYGQVNVENEWEKHTAKTGYENTFSVWTNAGYKAGFETPVGTVTVNPFVKYRPVQKYSEYNKHRKNKRITTEENEVRAGLGLGLTVK
jgi:putative fumarate reductase flavoprotein subunit